MGGYGVSCLEWHSRLDNVALGRLWMGSGGVCGVLLLPPMPTLLVPLGLQLQLPLDLHALRGWLHSQSG